jgi:hypothetical protein
MKTTVSQYTAVPSIPYDHPGYPDALAAAGYINKALGDAGDGTFTDDGAGEYDALRAVQVEINSCHPAIRECLTIDEAEIEIEVD